MRDMERNKQEFYYSLYSSETEVLDSNGNKTGEYATVYTVPTKMRANISASRGSDSVEPFGVDTPYSKTIVTCDMSCPIDETSRLWIGISTSLPYNYQVTGIAKSLNSITYAIKEVDVHVS